MWFNEETMYPQKLEGVYHHILWRGCKAVGPGELVNISTCATIAASQ